VLAGPAAAQAPPRLVGLTRLSPLVLAQDTVTCASTTCTPAGLPAPAAGFPWVGGTAYDSNQRSVWVSNGLQIAKVDARNACAPDCPVLPMPETSPNNPVTGLAYYEPANTVYVTDQANAIRWYTVGGGCQLSPVSRCAAPIPAGDVLTGCATDDLTGQIFYSAVTPGNPGGRVYVAQIGSPCLPFCSFAVTTCGTSTMGPLMGLAYDACAEVLWVTDGRFTKGISFDPISCAVLGETQCCTNTGEPYVGLDVLANNETTSGVSCTAPSCPACPTMAHVLPNDPYVGCATFSLDLINAPGASTAILFLNIGACGPPVLAPPFCAGLRVPLVPPPFTGFPLTGGTPGLCNGMASFNISIPLDPTLCGTQLCSQYLGICLPTGLYASNALGWTIGAS
jgi:hypothetical protein